jgi:hypothetical protein
MIQGYAAVLAQVRPRNVADCGVQITTGRAELRAGSESLSLL